MKKTFPVFLAFLAMGFGDAVGPFVGLAKNEFTLSNTMAYIIPFMGFIMFGILSVPVGIIQGKKGKKVILITGLIIMLTGLIIPTISISSYGMFLLTVLLLGAGAAVLQVSGNPIMRDVSEEGKYSRNLSLGQFVKAVGSLSGPIIPTLAAHWFGVDWKIIFPIFCIALAVTLVAVFFMNVQEKTLSDESEQASFISCLKLLKNKYILLMVLTIFLYVGAEVSMSSGIPIYLESQFGIKIEEFGLLGTGLFFTTLMIGRFFGGVILNWISPKKFFTWTSILSVVSIMGLFSGEEVVSFISVILMGFGFANIFPLVFSITVDTLPEKTNELSGLMVTAIVGGAFLPPLMGIVADEFSVLAGFIVPLIAVVYITAVAFYNNLKVKA